MSRTRLYEQTEGLKNSQKAASDSTYMYLWVSLQSNWLWMWSWQIDHHVVQPLIRKKELKIKT